MTLDILYFAWVREAVGRGSERLDVPDEVVTVADLIGWLATLSDGHAAAMADPARLRAAIDQHFVPLDARIEGAREIALFPPGDRRMIAVRVQREPFDPAVELAAMGSAGAVASFTGHVRADDGVTRLDLEHYPGMTERALEVIGDEAVGRWSLSAVRIVHRIGPMVPGDAIVFVAAASAHRAAALAACAFLIDRLKTDAPFWKRESRGPAAAASWVEPRAADDAAAARWRDQS